MREKKSGKLTENNSKVENSFYTFRQNNSGGTFDVSDDVAEYVIVEAEDSEEANFIAKRKAGIYFDGVSEGLDCSCCGDRWYGASQWDAYPEPCIYGCPAKEYMGWSSAKCIIYFKNGTKEILDIKKGNSPTGIIKSRS